VSLADALVDLRDELSSRLQDRWGGALASLAARTSDVLATYKAHLSNAGGAWHGTADTVNALTMIAPVTRVQAYLVLNAVRAGLAAHVLLEAGVHVAADTASVIASPEATDSASGVALANELADILDAHRTRAGVHALDDTANAITSDVAAAGTLAAPALIGDRHLSEHYALRVVLCWAGGVPQGPRDMCTNPKIITENRWIVEAHCWIARAEEEVDFVLRDVYRIRDAELLIQDVQRAVYARQHGMLGGRTESFTDVAVVRDAELMRFGEECICLFVVPIPVPEDPTYLPALGTPEAATGEAGLTVNPLS
jgi:uncharacterized protein YbaA (DUF1428 family)